MTIFVIDMNTKTNLVIFKKAIILIILFSTEISAQNNIITKNQNFLWNRYHLNIGINPKIGLQAEVDNREFLNNFKQNQFIGHLHLHYKFNQNAELSLGVSHSRVGAQFSDALDVLTAPENRIFQEFYVRKSNSKWQFQNRFRTEQRFFRKIESNELIEGYDFNLRVREQISISYLLHPKIRLKANDEIMFNFGKRIIYNRFDQNRIYGAAEWIPNQKISFELGYLRILQKRNSPTDYFQRDILRFTVFHKISLKNQ